MTAPDTPSREEYQPRTPERLIEILRARSEQPRSVEQEAASTIERLLLRLAAKPADDGGREAAEADRYFALASEFGNRIQRAVDLIDDYDMHGSVDHSVAFELKKIIDPSRALSRKQSHAGGDGVTIPLADHDEIGRKVFDLPWEVQKAIVTIAAHCVALKDEHEAGPVSDLAGCISHNCMELADALTASPPSGNAGERKDERPFAWTIPGDDNADCNGFIPAKISEEGEFIKPLYAAPPQPAPGALRLLRALMRIAHHAPSQTVRPVAIAREALVEAIGTWQRDALDDLSTPLPSGEAADPKNPSEQQVRDLCDRSSANMSADAEFLAKTATPFACPDCGKDISDPTEPHAFDCSRRPYPR